jgi:putative intracellular protease/amidase
MNLCSKRDSIPRTDRLALIQQLEKHRSSRVICYLTSDRQNADAPMMKDVLPLFYEHLVALGSPARVDVFLFTNGGDTMAAFGLARLLREFAEHLGLLVPRVCHSAGTLLAMGADEVLMTKAATLSPFDPSITSPLNPAVQSPAGAQLVPLSVESVAGFKGLVTDDWGLRGEQALGAAFQALTAKVHPLALGDVFRARQQIALLATKLLRRHRADGENIERIVDTLTRQLGSHDYLIARSEARELLGDSMVPIDSFAEPLIWQLYQDFAAEMELGTVFTPGPPGSAHVNKLAMIESEAHGNLASRTIQTRPGPGPGQIMMDVARSGWETYA